MIDTLRELVERNCTDRYERGGYFPLCWNWKMYGGVSYRQVFERMVTDNYVNMADALVCIPNVITLEEDVCVELDEWWNDAITDMARSFLEDDMMHYVTPEVAAKYGVTDGPFDLHFEVHGRSGGWVSLVEFEGMVLRQVYRRTLEEALDGCCEEYIRKLCAMVEEITRVIDNREDELIYQLAWRLKMHIDGEV